MRLSTRLDRYPGKMVSRLAERVIGEYTRKGDSVLDPFCGSGAILAAANRAGLRAAGIDLNPIAELFCRSKIGGFNPFRTQKLAEAWIAEANRSNDVMPVEWDAKQYWFTPKTLLKFEKLRAASQSVGLMRSPECWPVLLGYVLAVRLCSRADQRSPKPFISAHARRTRAGRHFDPNRTILELIQELSSHYGEADTRDSAIRFVWADVCDPEASFSSVEKHTHIITSPPYINAQDYFRNFKLELYLLEHILPFRVAGIKERFVGTERGNLLENVPSWAVGRHLTLAPEIADLSKRSPRLGAVVHRYLFDISNAFDVFKERLHNKGCLVVVCGDNLIGGVKICTWSILHRVLEDKGFVLFDRFKDPIRDRLLAPDRLGHRGLIKEEVVSAYRLQ